MDIQTSQFKGYQEWVKPSTMIIQQLQFRVSRVGQTLAVDSPMFIGLHSLVAGLDYDHRYLTSLVCLCTPRLHQLQISVMTLTMDISHLQIFGTQERLPYPHSNVRPHSPAQSRGFTCLSYYINKKSPLTSILYRVHLSVKLYKHKEMLVGYGLEGSLFYLII